MNKALNHISGCRKAAFFICKLKFQSYSIKKNTCCIFKNETDAKCIQSQPILAMLFQSNKFILIFLLSILYFGKVFSQACVDDFFAMQYNTPTVQKPQSSVITQQKDIMLAGNVQRTHSLLQVGWLTKYSAQGTLLWSRQFGTSKFNFVQFNTIIDAGNDEYIVAGNVGDVDTSGNPLIYKRKYALIIRVDKFGGIIWSQVLSKVFSFNEFTEVKCAINLPGNDLLIALQYRDFQEYSVIMKMDANGKTKWSTTIHSADRSSTFNNPQLKLLSDGSFLFLSFASVTQNTFFPYQGTYLACMNADNGTRKWENFIVRTDTLPGAVKNYGENFNIIQQADGGFSFISSYGEGLFNYFRTAKYVLQFNTNNYGITKKVTSYTNDKSLLYATAANQINEAGNRLILMDDADAPVLMETTPDGQITRINSYPAVGRSQETKSLNHTDAGNYFFSFTHNGGSKELKLVKTDTASEVACIEKPYNIYQQDVTSDYYNQLINLVYESPTASWYDFSLTMNDYKLEPISICRKACCSDVVNNELEEIYLCDLNAYVLPNKDTAFHSGVYTITHKTKLGCDSIVYYNLHFNYTPVVNLGSDTCIGEKDFIVIKTAEGYDHYLWNGNNTNNNSLAVKEPGTYIVSTDNACGADADTVLIFKQCAFEVFMPTAFTPNGDGLNDVFRVPPLNYNLLKSLVIYNRWGQQIFSTSDANAGWNGMYKSLPAPNGTYIYVLVMQSLDKFQTFSKKGFFTLIR